MIEKIELQIKLIERIQGELRTELPNADNPAEYHDRINELDEVISSLRKLLALKESVLALLN